MRDDLIERLRERARNARREGNCTAECDARLYDEAAAALEAAREDAGRYRWLRDSQKVAGSGPEIRLWNRDEVTYGRELHEHGLDAAIDQARGKAGGEVSGG